MSIPEFVICIPTYKRAQLLLCLLADLAQQTVQPQRVIVVDGDTSSDDLLKDLRTAQVGVEIVYISSNHANAAYQRYLGALYSPSNDIILYLDDDIRIHDSKAVERLLLPFSWSECNVVGATGNIVFPNRQVNKSRSLIRSRSWQYSRDSRRRYGVTPTGHRIIPNREIEPGPYIEVGWLHGGVMAYKTQTIRNNPHYPDVFALGHIRCGLGADDTYLSRWAGRCGRLILSTEANFYHPDADESRAYPADGFNHAYAVTYSRRFLNDNYRIVRPPTIGDRLALVKSYAGGILRALAQVFRRPDKYNLSIAFGTVLGSIHGLIRAPTSKRLTPHIDWWADAEEALRATEIIQSASS